VNALWLVALLAPLPLPDAVRLAVERDPALQAAGLRVREAEASEASARGAFDLHLIADLQLNQTQEQFSGPGFQGLSSTDLKEGKLQLGFVKPLVWGTQVQLSWINDVTRTNNPFLNCIPGLTTPTCWITRFELKLNQPLLRGFGRDATEARVVQAQSDRDVSERQRADTAAQLVEGVVDAYAELAFARADRDIREQALKLAQEQLESTKTRVDLGRLAPADLPVVEQTVAQRQRELFDAERLLSDRAAALASRLRVPEAPEVAMPDGAAEPGPLPAAEEAASTHNPELAALDAQIEGLRRGLAPLEDATLPRLDLAATASRGGTDESYTTALTRLPDGQSTQYLLDLSFDWPPANTTAEAELRRARLALDRAKLEREARRTEVVRATGDAWRAARTATHDVELTRRVAELSAKAVDAEREKFAAGRSTNLDVLRVQQDYAQALLAVERARADELQALTRLRRLTGSLLGAYDLTIR
jgi:outer membrane protein TolC